MCALAAAKAEQLIIVGDTRQLPPTVASASAELRHALGVSPMERLERAGVGQRTLRVQYRMPPELLEHPSRSGVSKIVSDRATQRRGTHHHPACTMHGCIMHVYPCMHSCMQPTRSDSRPARPAAPPSQVEPRPPRPPRQIFLRLSRCLRRRRPGLTTSEGLPLAGRQAPVIRRLRPRPRGESRPHGWQEQP